MASMKIETYNPTNMQMVSSDVTGVDFGNVVRGNHNTSAVVIRPVADGGTFDQLALFLENAGGLTHCQFGKYVNSAAVTGITPGDPQLSDYFVEAAGISDVSQIAGLSDNGIVLDAGAPEYIWVDVEAGVGETNLGAQSVNFRFVFEYV